MTYHVEFTEKAKKFLKKLDKYTAKIITSWIRKNLEGCSDPRHTGKSLTSNRNGQWRYRVGEYRILADIQDNKVLILVLDIGHRRDIYDD